MATCLCDAFFAEAAKATVEVLEHLGVEVLFPEDQTCCGQPALNAGDWASSRKVVRHAMDVFAGDLPIIVPSGSCAAMNFHGAPLEFEKECEAERARVADYAHRTWEVLDYIVHGLGVTTWPGRYEKKIAFHHSCHTRGTGTRPAARTLLGDIDGLEMLQYGQGEQCCGFGGTFSVVFPNISTSMGKLKLEHLLEHGPDELVAADMSCLMHLSGISDRAGKPLRIRHATEILRDALASR